MDLVDVDPDAAGLALMLADLIRANLEREPGRRDLIVGKPARVRLHVTDADVEVGLDFTGERLRVGADGARADLSIACDAATLMQLTNVPLRFGMPDTLTSTGREIAGKLMRKEIDVRGLPRHLPLMIRLNRLFTVA